MSTDTGWAWVVLGGSMMGLFLSGVQRYFVGVMHAELLIKYQASNITTAWVGALYMSLMDLGGPLASVVIGKYGCRVCCILGSLLCFIGFAASAFTTSITQLFFTYGLVAGLGFGLTYSPSVLCVGYYFNKLLPMASGLSSAAAAVGMLFGPLLVQNLINEFHVSGGFLLLAAICLHHCVSGMLFRPSVYGQCSLEVPGTLDSADDEDGLFLQRTDHAAEHGKEGAVLVNGGGGHARRGSSSSHDRVYTKRKSKAARVGNESEDTGPDRNHDDQLQYQTIYGNSGSSDHQAEHRFQHNHGKRHSNNNSANVDTTDGELDTGDDLRTPFISPKDLPSSIKEETDVTDIQEEESVETSSQPDHSDTSVTLTNGGTKLSSLFQRLMDNYRQVLSNRAFMLHCCSLLLSGMHQSGAFFHLPEYVQTLGTSPNMAAQLFVAAGIGSLISRLSSGILTTDVAIDPLIISIGMTGLTALVTMLLPLYSATYTGQTAFGLLAGLYTGGLAALLNVLTKRFVGVVHMHTAFGVSIFLMGIGGILGPLLAALVVDYGGRYEHSFIILGSLMLMAALLDLVAGVTFSRHSTADDVDSSPV